MIPQDEIVSFFFTLSDVELSIWTPAEKLELHIYYTQEKPAAAVAIQQKRTFILNTSPFFWALIERRAEFGIE